MVADVDIVDAPENSIVPNTGSASSSGTVLLEEKKTILHGGLEYLFLSNKKTEVRMQVGGYQEPARIDTVEDRFHLTMGLEVRFGPAVLGVAYDQAKNFQNTAASFSLSLGNI